MATHAILRPLALCALLGAASASAEQGRPQRNPHWEPIWQDQGSYDAVMCEGTPFWWPKDKKMYLMECVCRGPLDQAGWGNPYVRPRPSPPSDPCCC